MEEQISRVTGNVPLKKNRKEIGIRGLELTERLSKIVLVLTLEDSELKTFTSRPV